MIWGLCESPITFNAIIGWSNALNEGRDAAARDPRPRGDAVQGPDAEQLTEPRKATRARRDQREGRRPLHQGRGRGADEPERAPTSEEDEDMVERARAAAAVEEDEDEDNTLSLAQMEEKLKPQALEKFAEITGDLSRNSPKVQGSRMDAMRGRRRLPPSDEKKYQRLREELTAAGRKRPVPRQQDRISRRPALQLQPPPDRARRPDAAPRRAPQRAAQGVPRKLYGPRARRQLARRMSPASTRNGPPSPPPRRHGRAHPHRDQPTSPSRPACRSPSSAASSTWSRKASARRASPRRKWSRPTSASSSPSPRNTPTAACSSSTSSRKATSA